VVVKHDSMVAAYCYLIGGGSYDTGISDTPMSARELVDKKKQLIIGSDCWLGAGAKILEGIKVGDGAVIGAGAVVTHDIPEYGIATGIPARIMKYREA